MSVRGKKERWCYKVRRGGKKQSEVDVLRKKQRDGERGQAAGSSHRHALLSKQLSSQGRVAAGHGGITLLANKRELLSHKAAHDSPVTLGSCNKAKAALNLQTKKLTRYRSTAANFHEVGVERSTPCRQLGLGVKGYYWDEGKLWRLVLSQKIPHLSWAIFTKLSAQGIELLLFRRSVIYIYIKKIAV